MASRIYGIDLGAYSVKVVIANPGFRNPQVLDMVERRVPAGDEPHIERAARVLGEIVRELGLEDDAGYAAVAGDQVFLHVLEFAFKSLKRADLERAVGAELEGVLPIDLEDMVYAFEQLPRDVGATPAAAGASDLGQPLPEEEPTFVQGQPAGTPAPRGLVAPPTEGMRVLACAMLRTRALEMLSAIDGVGAEARGLIAAPASYTRVADRIGALEGARSAGHAVAVLDIGHQRTDVCVLQGGKALFARTLSRGGHDLTASIARGWSLSYEQAESAKHQDGFVASAREPAQSQAWQRIHEVLADELVPLARDLRRTLSACLAKTGASVERVVLVGGSARLRGLASFLSEQLHVPVECISPEDNGRILGQAALGGSYADVACLAAGVAFEGAGGRPAFDLRQGALAYKGDLSLLRAKASQLAIASLAVVVFALISGWTGLQKLRSAEETLDRRVALESTEAFGEKLDAEAVLARIGPEEGGAASPIPAMTAYDLLLAFDAALPPKDEVTLDVEEIEIKGGKLTVKAASSPTGDKSALQGIKSLEQSLRASKCFKDFSSPESQPGANDSREFTLTIKTDCE